MWSITEFVRRLSTARATAFDCSFLRSFACSFWPTFSKSLQEVEVICNNAVTKMQRYNSLALMRCCWPGCGSSCRHHARTYSCRRKIMIPALAPRALALQGAAYPHYLAGYLFLSRSLDHQRFRTFDIQHSMSIISKPLSTLHQFNLVASLPLPPQAGIAQLGEQQTEVTCSHVSCLLKVTCSIHVPGIFWIL